MKKILVIGSAGQIGTELVLELRNKYGNENVIAGINRTMPSDEVRNSGPMETVNAMNIDEIENVVKKYEIDSIFHLASLLSAVGEQKPDLAWSVNMGGLKNILDLAKKYNIKVFWPSSIACFGPTTPRENTPQKTILEPNTMYGVTKVAGELMCNYYFNKFDVDVRSLRYPGIISYKTLPGGGTTDYAIDIFFKAIKGEEYVCFLNENSTLPMMYMPDAIKATIDIMEADKEKIKIRTSYNLAAVSFSPNEIYNEIVKYMPDFKIKYIPDFRQKIADSWPKSIDDSSARQDWNWKHAFNLSKMTEDMLFNLKKILK
ncbi:MAG: NAD-dependent epimerase/dehydratase family protein [Nanoarchaeota archaeon]|nr:NAD-dependent epimerase/dehydratase family protein [Nanoarchaeota archaeon]